MDAHLFLGWLLIALGTICILLAFAIGVRQYVLQPSTQAKTQAIDFDLAKLIAELITAILKAPPALAFLVVGALLIVGGNRLLSGEPLLPRFTKTKHAQKADRTAPDNAKRDIRYNGSFVLNFPGAAAAG